MSPKKALKPIQREYKPPRSIWGMKIPKLPKSESTKEVTKERAKKSVKMQYSIDIVKQEKTVHVMSTHELILPKMEKIEHMNMLSKDRHVSGNMLHYTE